jgi:hypothetical protein
VPLPPGIEHPASQLVGRPTRRRGTMQTKAAGGKFRVKKELPLSPLVVASGLSGLKGRLMPWQRNTVLPSDALVRQCWSVSFYFFSMARCFFIIISWYKLRPHFARAGRCTNHAGLVARIPTLTLVHFIHIHQRTHIIWTILNPHSRSTPPTCLPISVAVHRLAGLLRCAGCCGDLG